MLIFYVSVTTCPVLTIPLGSVDYSRASREYRSVATYSCDLGYALQGNERRRCNELGKWTGHKPYCNSKTCTPNVSI